MPQNVEKLNGVGICQIECGAQFSLALSKSGHVWTWGKGDYFRLGHGNDQHVRKPTVVECLRGKKIVHVAVGALHCLAVTDSGQVYAWGDNDHGQQGNSTTTVNKKPALVHGLDGHQISRVACGSSHSVCWTSQDTPSSNCHEPVLFTESKDPLGVGFVSNKISNDSNTASSSAAGHGGHGAAYSTLTAFSSSSLPHNYPLLTGSGSGGRKPARPSLSRIILSLESNAAKQQALQHILNALQILYSREAVVSALTPHGGQPTTASNKKASNVNPILSTERNRNVTTAAVSNGREKSAVPLASPESPSDISGSVDQFIGGGGEAPADCPNDVMALSLQTTPDSEEPSSSNSAFGPSVERGYTKLSSLPHGLSPSSVMAGAMISPLSESSSIDQESLEKVQVNNVNRTVF